MNSPVAVILRTHLVNDKVHDLLTLLSKSTQYDLYVAADETSAHLDLPGYKKLSHSVRSCRYFDLYTKHPHIFWHCGDYALYLSALQIPNYQYYILIEYDVDFVRRSPLFLDQLVTELGSLGSPDLVCPSFHEADAGWLWTEAAAKQFPKVYTTSTFAFVAVSAVALDYLYERRKKEALECRNAKDIVMCEAFCASALVEGGYTCASINDLIEGAVDFSTFHPPMPNLEISHYLLNQYKIADPKIEIVHPVYDLRNYLERQYEKYRALEQQPRFLEDLDRISTTGAFEGELVLEYREIALGQRARLSEKMTVQATKPFVKRKTVAIVTDSMSPGFYFPLWFRYYSGQFGASAIHILTLPGVKQSFAEFSVASVTEMEDFYNDNSRLAAITKLVAELTKIFDYVIRVDSDEFLVAEPSKYENLSDYVNSLEQEYVTARGFDVYQHTTELSLDLQSSILIDQRRYAFALTAMNKTSITSVPLRWNRGFHCCSVPPEMGDLLLFHLKRADIQQQLAWNKFMAQQVRDDEYTRNYYETPEEKIQEFHTNFSHPTGREVIRGDEALNRIDFDKRFLDSVDLNPETGLYEAPYLVEEVNVFVPARFRGKL